MNIQAAASVAPNVSSNPFPPLPQEDEGDLRELFARWEDLAKSEHSMPPVSPLIFRLLRMDRDAPLAVGEVTEIVESDPILTARLLGLANSALFVRPGKPISDVKSAVIRLGINEAFEETFTQLFGMWVRHISRMPDDALLDALWIENLITAFAAREIATTLRDPAIDPALTYTAALLHDVGTLALCWADAKPMARFIKSGYAYGTGLHRDYVDAHCRLGSRLLQDWNAPLEYAEVAARHHQPLNHMESGMAAVVYLADHLHDAVTQHEAWSFQTPSAYPLGCIPHVPENVTAALTALGLDDKLEGIIERVALQSARIESLARMP